MSFLHIFIWVMRGYFLYLLNWNGRDPKRPSIVPAPSVIEWNSLFELSFQCLWNPSLERSFEELDFSFPFPIWRAFSICHMGFNLPNIIRHFADSKSRWWNDVYYFGKRIEKWLESNSVFLGRIHELEIEKESYCPMTHFDYFFSTVEEIRNFVRSSESSKTQEGRNLSRYFNILDNSLPSNPRELSSKEYQLRGILNEKAFWEFHLRYPGFRQLTYDSLGIDRTLLIIPQ